MEAVQNEILRPQDVIVGAPTTDMASAIELVGQRLVDRGVIEPEYIDSMKRREETVSTYLGNGVAMPHGTYDMRDAVKSTGIVVAQFPDGVDWGAGTAHIVIGLAASGDDHVQVLSQMAEVLQDEELCEQLAITDDADLLYQTLTNNGDDSHADESAGSVATADVTVSNPAGLHARPATLVVELAKGSASEVVITKGEKSASGKSIMSVLALGATVGDTVTVTIDGDDAEETLAAVINILTSQES